MGFVSRFSEKVALYRRVGDTLVPNGLFVYGDCAAGANEALG